MTNQVLYGALDPASPLCRFAKFRFCLISRLLLRSRFYRRFCYELQSQKDSSGSVLCCDRLPYFQSDCFVLRLHLVVLFSIIGGFCMVESAPMFIEYCCEGYMLMRGVTALCICSFVSAVFACFLSFLFWNWLD